MNLKLSRLFFEAIALLKKSAPTILLFEIFYKALMGFVFKPFLNYSFSLIVKISGYQALVNMDIKNFATSIVGLITILSFLLLAILFIFYEYAVILKVLDASYNNKKISLLDALKEGLLSLEELKNRKKLGLASYLLFLLPVINIGIQSSFLPEVDIPRFITGELEKYPGGSIFLTMLIFGLVIIYAKSFLILPYMVLGNKNFKDARRESFKAIKNNALKVSLFTIIVSILWMALAYAPINLLQYKSGFIYELLKILAFLSLSIFTLLASPLMLTIMLALYRKFVSQSPLKKDDFTRAMRINTLDLKVEILRMRLRKFFRKISKVLFRKKIYIIFLVLLSFLAYYMFLPVKSGNQLVEPLVIGHRGSYEFVENSKEAILSSARLGADYAEIDILLSKDGVPMVIHDENLLRLTGKLKRVSKMTQKELENIEIRSKGDRANISSLEDILKETEGRVDLLVEIKTHGREEKDVVKEVMDIVDKYGQDRDIIFQTAEKDVFKRMSENYPHKKLGYIIIGKLGPIDKKSLRNFKADFLVFEESIINQRIINNSHLLGIPIFAWTVNEPEEAEKLFKMKVDGIITDYPDRMNDLRRDIFFND